MCMNLLYKNSPNNGEVDIAYLAINDKMLINKTYMNDCYLENYSFFNNEILVWGKNKVGATIFTLLLTFNDVEFDWEDENSEWRIETLQGQLTTLSNENMMDELFDNLFDMISDAIHINGITENTYLHKLFMQAFNNVNLFYQRTVDFNMHEPTQDNIHPMYDT